MIGHATDSARASRVPSGTSTQPRFGAIETRPSLRRTTPATATPMPTIGQSPPGAQVGGRAPPGRSTTSSTRQLAARPVDAGRARGSRRPGRRSRPRSSRRGSRGRGRRRRRVQADERRGPARRPEARGALLGDQPAAASSPTSARIALRVRPVAATRSERDCGPLLVEARGRSRSGSPGGRSRCADRRRRGRTRKVCVPLLQTCARLVQRAVRVKSAHGARRRSAVSVGVGWRA